jgi:hypothetical protein
MPNTDPIHTLAGTLLYVEGRYTASREEPEFIDMDFLGGLPGGSSLITPAFFWSSTSPTLFWALLAVPLGMGLVFLLDVGVRKFITGGKTVTDVVYEMTACGISGHYFRVHEHRWRCVTCGEGAPYEAGLLDRGKGVAA